MILRKIAVLGLMAVVLAITVATASPSSDASGECTVDGITYVLQGENAAICGYSGDQSEILIPDKVDIGGVQRQVVSVLDNTNPFGNGHNITSFAVDPANRYFKIVDGVLFNASGTILLAYPAGSDTAEYIVPGSVQILAKYAFKGCENLRTLHLGNGIVRISDYGFAECTSLREITFSPYLRSIGDNSFLDCTSLEGIAIPDAVSDIGIAAFKGCSSLTDVELPSNLTFLSPDLFRGCSALAGLTIPASVNQIYDNVFSGCYNLMQLNIVCAELGTLAPTAFRIGDSENPVECYVNCSTSGFDPEDYSDEYTTMHVNEESFVLRIHSQATVTEYLLMCGESLDMDLPVRTGYRIGSWTDGHGTTMVFPKRMPACDLDLYVVWVPVSYSIIFHSNDGSERTYVQSVTYDIETTLHLGRYSQQHMCFTGWRDSSDTHYDDGQHILNLSTGADFHLYAEWTSPDYIIHYESGIGEGEMEDQPFLSGVLYATYSNGFVTPGYVFFGWSGSNGIDYFDGQNVRDLGTGGETIIFTAKWEPIKYAVHYDKQGGSGSAPTTIAVYGETYNVPKGITKGGYILAGWSLDKDSTAPEIAAGSNYTNLTDIDGKELTLYAIWRINVYTVFYVANGGTGSMEHQLVTYGDTPNLNKCTFTRLYSDFLGWAFSPNGVVTYADESQLPGDIFPTDNSLNLYAVWENWKYVIHFDANGGEGSMSDLLTECNTEIQLPSCGFTSYTSFKGWSLTPGGKIEYSDKALATNISRGASEVTLYAVWVIPVDDDGGSDNMAFIAVGAVVVILVIIAGATVFFRKH